MNWDKITINEYKKLSFFRKVLYILSVEFGFRR